jgi:hypothetical protein
MAIIPAPYLFIETRLDKPVKLPSNGLLKSTEKNLNLFVKTKVATCSVDEKTR